ncbi:MAG: carbohydrate ABC transporter permease [Clostridia bacterium]|nr:carbohydrate ABC transporter permease [Clostridia bacterium]
MTEDSAEPKKVKGPKVKGPKGKSPEGFKITSGPVGQSATFGSRAFDVINYALITLIAFTTILPFIYIVGASFATEYELTVRPMFIIPQDVSFEAYEYIFSSNKLISAFGNSVFITVFGTIINLFFTVTFAYPLSKQKLRGRNFLLNMVIVSMFFSGGMVPGYLLVSNWLGMKNTYWSVLLPGAISAYNMMIVKNFFQGIPQELEESAHIDGCNDLVTLIKIVLPLSLPVLATFGLFYAVGHWNSYFSAMIYMSGARDKWPLQVILREIIIMSTMSAGDLALMDPNFKEPPAQSIKMAVIVVSTVPIMCVYPFLQKYFVKGVMVGALKG